MLYVCPHFDGMTPEMSEHARLYAYPCQPEAPSSLVILDSGAFGLSQRGRQIGIAHMRQLAEHYRPYAGQPGYICIAPDAYLDPRLTMRNWQWWQDHIGLPVAPVIQFTREGQIDVYHGLQQADYYARWQPAALAISNPALTAYGSAGLAVICATVRRNHPHAWLHNLGAGWTPTDIADWRQSGLFDSIDSTAYYTDAQRGSLWRLDGRRENVTQPWRQTAIENARVAVLIARDAQYGGKY